MACPAFGSTSEVSLWYGTDTDPKLPLTGNETWNQVRMTGESLDMNMTSTVSDEITPQRSYSNSKLTQGEVTGSINFEASKYALQDFLIAVLQDPTAFGAWSDGITIKNGSTKKCLRFMKKVSVGSETHYYIYRGCQMSSLSLNMEPSALITGETAIMGVNGYEQDTDPVTGGSYVDATNDPLLSGVDSLKSLSLQDANNFPVNVTFQNLSITFDNQLRQQFAVGTDSIFAAGTASSRFMCTMSSTQYYSSHAIYDALRDDTELHMSFSLEDSAGNGFGFNLARVKVQSGAVPLAGGPDQDLLVSPEMQAFEDATTGTVSITADFDSTVEASAPRIVTGTVEPGAPSDIVITFAEGIQVTDDTGMSVTVDGGGSAVTSASASGNVLTVVMTTPIANGEVVVFSYDGDTGNLAASGAGNTPAGDVSYGITNNV